MGAPRHRGAVGSNSAFARRFLQSRLAGFEKDIRICLTGIRAKTRPGITHAYFPALATCCATLEYLAALYRGNIRGVGWQQAADWAGAYLPQPDYDRDTVRILFDAFRHPVAHRGIATGVWVDHHLGAGHGRRVTWKVFANSKRPPCRVVAEQGDLVRDPPWPCRYTHRVHIHLKGIASDIRKGAARYSRALAHDEHLVRNFMACMRQLYPH
jgi:hypothetical protein